MSAPLVLVHPQPDYTGVNPDYRAVNEQQDLQAKNSYIIVLNYGAFYAGSLVVINAADGAVLKPGKNEDYYSEMLDPIATAKSSKTVHCTLTVNEARFPTKPVLIITYQFVGGPYQLNTAALEQAVSDLETQPDTVYWDNVLNKPVAYPPSYHTHDASDITHLESTNAALWAIKLSIDNLAETQANETVPPDMVRYGGVTKYTIDTGINLIDYIQPSLSLQFPRSLSENAIFALRITYLTAGTEYYIKVHGTEAVLGGFNFTNIETNITDVVGITSATITSSDGKNYLQINTDLNTHPAGWGTGFIVVENVVVWCDDTDDYNHEYVWLATPGSASAVLKTSDVELTTMHPAPTVPAVNKTRYSAIDMTTLEKDKLYLLEVVLSGLDASKLTNRMPVGAVNFQATYNPDTKAGLLNGELLGTCFGQLMYGANANFGSYYDIKGVLNHTDKSLFAFDSFYVCPQDENTDKYSVYLYVKGSGMLHVYTDAEAVILHTSEKVVVGFDAHGEPLEVSNEVSAPEAIGMQWVKFCDVPVNQPIVGFPVLV